MRDEFVGDIGDFGRSGLLRTLIGSGPTSQNDGMKRLKLGVVWYTNQHDGKGGNVTKYLCNKHKHHCALRKCDFELFDKLYSLVYGNHGNDRKIREFESSRIFPCGTEYHTDPVPQPPKDQISNSKVAERYEWLQCAIRKMGSAELVFLDPDNGISQWVNPTITKAQKDATKLAFLYEVRRFWEEEKSLIVYHHLQRNSKKHQGDIEMWATVLQCELNLPTLPWAVRADYNGKGRVFFIIPCEQNKLLLRKRIDHFIKGPFGTTKIGKTPFFQKVILPEAPPCP